MNTTEVERIAATGNFRGWKRKHVREAYRNVDEETVQAIHEARRRQRATREARGFYSPTAVLDEDPLLAAARSRPGRTPTARARAAVENATRLEELQRHYATVLRLEGYRVAARKSLLDAARIARKLGFAVRSSKDRRGRVSSYYLSSLDGPTIRVSDHDIPATAERVSNAAFHGRSYNGFAGPELLITDPRSSTWLRRALMLTAAGRDVPGA